MTGLTGFKACYRHPNKPAIRDCKKCGQPICKKCEEESGDPELCAPCKFSADKDRKVPPAEEPAAGADRTPAPLPIGEVTVVDEGSVTQAELAGGAFEAEAWKAVPPPTEPKTSGFDGLEPQPTVESITEAVPEKADALALESQLPDASGTETGPESFLVPSPVPVPVPGPESAAAGAATEEKEADAPALEQAAQTESRLGPWSQILYALPYALGAAAIVSGLWLLFAYFGREWSQVSVFTLGLIVPWALFNATTRKRRMGIRVWSEPPPVPYISVTAFSIVAAFTPILEYLAYNAVFRGATSDIPFGDFVQRYFKTTDWLLVAGGLALGLLAPFLLKVGAEWSTPSFRRARAQAKSGGEETAESIDVPQAETPEGTDTE